MRVEGHETCSQALRISVVMAYLQINFLSESLCRQTILNAVVPVGGKPFKTLYLLHGLYGNCMDWLANTRIAYWAEARNLAVIMPSADNSFYTDNEKSFAMYGEFFGRELVDVTRELLPLSHRREDTFIAGLSMGGYGAIRTGLKYHKTFGAIAGLSSALITDDAPFFTNASPEIIRPVLQPGVAEFARQNFARQGSSNDVNVERSLGATDAELRNFDRKDGSEWLQDRSIGRRSFFEMVFGDLDKLKGSENDPKFLISRLKREEIPALYLCCGTDDFLIEQNRDFHKFLREKNVAHTYVEGAGSHTWEFWDEYILKVLDWLDATAPEEQR